MKYIEIRKGLIIFLLHPCILLIKMKIIVDISILETTTIQNK